MKLRPMRETQMRLYGFLRKHQESGASFTFDEMVEYTGYRDRSLASTLQKHFIDTWVFRIDGGHFVVRDFTGVTPIAFANAMCQITRLSFEDEKEWRMQLSKLLALGLQHGFPVMEAFEEAIGSLTAPAGGAGAA